MSAKLLNGLRSNSRDFSERALINKANHLDFDSAIPRFESWRPSQYPRCDPRQHSGSTLIDRTEVNDPEQKLVEAATRHLTTPDE